MIVTEDGWEDTVRPRLEVAGADLDRLHVLCVDQDGTGTPTFPEDMSVLQDNGVVPSLVVVDAWIDTVAGGLQVKDTQKARQAVSPWKKYAAKTGAAILLVTHTNRQESQDIRNTYGLSGGLRQVARSTMYALEDPGSQALIVGPDKSNLGAKGVAHWFEKTPVQHFAATTNSDGTVALLDSICDDHRTIQEVLAEQNDVARPVPKTNAIDLWLRDILSDGPVPSAELLTMANAEGYSEDQLRGARDRVGATRKRVGSKWMTSL